MADFAGIEFSSPERIMNSILPDLTRFKSQGIAGLIRRTVVLVKTEKWVIKFKIRFGEETRVEVPIRGTTRARV